MDGIFLVVATHESGKGVRSIEVGTGTGKCLVVSPKACLVDLTSDRLPGWSAYIYISCPDIWMDVVAVSDAGIYIVDLLQTTGVYLLRHILVYAPWNARPSEWF